MRIVARGARVGRGRLSCRRDRRRRFGRATVCLVRRSFRIGRSRLHGRAFALDDVDEVQAALLADDHARIEVAQRHLADRDERRSLAGLDVDTVQVEHLPLQQVVLAVAVEGVQVGETRGAVVGESDRRRAGRLRERHGSAPGQFRLRQRGVQEAGHIRTQRCHVEVARVEADGGRQGVPAHVAVGVQRTAAAEPRSHRELGSLGAVPHHILHARRERGCAQFHRRLDRHVLDDDIAARHLGFLHPDGPRRGGTRRGRRHRRFALSRVRLHQLLPVDRSVPETAHDDTRRVDGELVDRDAAAREIERAAADLHGRDVERRAAGDRAPHLDVLARELDVTQRELESGVGWPDFKNAVDVTAAVERPGQHVGEVARGHDEPNIARGVLQAAGKWRKAEVAVERERPVVLDVCRQPHLALVRTRGRQAAGFGLQVDDVLLEAADEVVNEPHARVAHRRVLQRDRERRGRRSRTGLCISRRQLATARLNRMLYEPDPVQ